ncbi:hypothetical protein GJ496_007588 [Pomphorhynchus laevis]|nr:hypothetical protein GJ496_007588 [Pomphorhynchus laevis]
MSKYEPIVKPAKLIHVNPKYAIVKYSSGHQKTISIRDIATTPSNNIRDKQESSKENNIIPIRKSVESTGELLMTVHNEKNKLPS